MTTFWAPVTEGATGTGLGTICGCIIGIGVVTGIEVLIRAGGGTGTGVVIVARGWTGNVAVTGVVTGIWVTGKGCLTTIDFWVYGIVLGTIIFDEVW